MAGPDFSSREPAELARIFEFFGEVECPELDAHLYRALCRGIVGDESLLALASRAPATQPPPNLLFGAVHYLLLGGARHDLREWYPALAENGGRDPATAFPVFREFCLSDHDRIEELIETRLTQTNVIQRCSALLPAFARVFEERGGRPLAVIEIGPSAGLNLQWDRFRYFYAGGASYAGGAFYSGSASDAGSASDLGGDVTWGDPQSPVLIPCDVRGDPALPPLPEKIPVASRCGVDIHPIDITDADAVRWLRALIWPDHVGRQERLSRAIEIAQAHPPEIVAGDASTELASLIASAPKDAAVCVYCTHTLYQFPSDALRETLRGMQTASKERPVDFVSMEGTGDRCSELRHTRYRDGERETTLVANCNPHGRWLEWLA